LTTMLSVDLRQLERKNRLTIETDLPVDSPLWKDAQLPMAEPLAVRLQAQQAGHDVVVRGTLRGSVALACRRCLAPVTAPIDEDVSLVYRPGLTQVEAEAEEVYALPGRGDELDLSPAIREQVVLAVPQYGMCREDCRGLCPHCGTNLNQETCNCTSNAVDPRWAALRAVRKDVSTR
jgi:uncharacterized protein